MKPEYYFFGDIRFTLREMQLISLLIQHSERCHIAEKLGVTSGTLKQEVGRVYAKLRVHCVHQFLIWAFNNHFDTQGNYKGEKLI